MAAGNELPLPPPLVTGDENADRQWREFFRALVLKLVAPLLTARWLEVCATQPDLPSGAVERRFAVKPPYVRDIALVAGIPNVIPHRLTGPLTGWAVVDKNATADIWRSATLADGSEDAASLVLWCSADVTARVQVL
jgi:hypothetical protein